jgi:hypothetical protein
VTCMDRRQMLVLSLGAAAATTVLGRVLSQDAHAAPPSTRAIVEQAPGDLIDKAQVVVVAPGRRRRRRRVCWWHRGRRVCDWRWR